MEPFRRKVKLPSGSDYWFVVMGPHPRHPEWHQKLYSTQSYGFPTKEAAELFARTHTDRDPERSIEIRQGE